MAPAAFALPVPHEARDARAEALLDIVAGFGAGDPFDAAFATARFGVGPGDAPSFTPFTGRLDVALSLVAFYDALGLTAPPAAVVAFADEAAALPLAWRVSVANLLDASTFALTAAAAGPVGELAGAEAVARAARDAHALLTQQKSTPDPVRLRDPLGVMRIDTGRTSETYTEPHYLIVDWAGDDRYVGAQGAAWRQKPLGVVVDLNGDDVYVTPSAAHSAAQGGSSTGVLGFVYDGGGDDRYDAAQSAPGQPSAFQGGCWGAGVGLLVDAGGNDTYTAHFNAQGAAQGAGFVCTGMLLDLGGNDTFTAGDARGPAAQGAGHLGGTGVLVNRGGHDSYTATNPSRQGGAYVALGVLVDYGGDDAYDGDDTWNDAVRLRSADPVQQLGLLVDRAAPAEEGRLVLPSDVRDDDGDDTPAVYFSQYDVRTRPDGNYEIIKREPFTTAGPYVGDPDDFERTERIDLTGAGRCVIALVDTGINVYHREFRALGATSHPSTYLADFPATAPQLTITHNAPDYAQAVAADAALWASVQGNTLYTVPGTHIIGAISIGTAGSTPIGATRILDDDGHGTAVASAAAGATTGVGPGCGIVAVEAGDRLAALRWIAEQPWIDVVSLSVGTFAGAYLPSEIANATRALTRTGKMVVVAAGNGATGFDVPDPTPTLWSPYAGPGWVVTVGASAPWNDMPVWWGAYPVDVLSQGVNVRVAGSRTLVDTTTFGGSSAAAPRVAGVAGAVLAAARTAVATGTPASGPLADGTFTRGEWESVVLRSARVANMSSFAGQCLAAGLERCALSERWWFYLVPSVDQAEFVTSGYGIIDGGTRDVAAAAVAGLRPEPRRDRADTWWRGVHATREAVWAAHDDQGLYLNVQD